MKKGYFNNMQISLDTKTLAKKCFYRSFNMERTTKDLGTGSGPQVITTGGAN